MTPSRLTKGDRRSRRRLAGRRRRRSGQGGAPRYNGRPHDAVRLAAIISAYSRTDRRIARAFLEAMR